MNACPHQIALGRWVRELAPMRLWWVGSPTSAAQLHAELARTNASRAGWAGRLPQEARPVLLETPRGEIHAAPPGQTFDLAIIAIEPGTPKAAAQAEIAELMRRCRFVAAIVPSGGASDENAWDDAAWQRLRPLAVHQHGGRTAFLAAGGRAIETDGPEPRIWYLAPNRQIYGGVKILYNHVEMLRGMGMPAVLGVEEDHCWPASWFAWDPRHVVFGTEAAKNVRPCDTVVIPEFRHRLAPTFAHAARRLLFVQNPGFARGIRDWGALGYDGVLTLGKPDGSPSFLQRYLLEKGCRVPVFAVPNHFDDDAWHRVRAEKIPGRILCLPRKGPEYVDRLEREFSGRVVRANNLHQLQMAVEYAKADVYAHTGFPEGLGMPIVEAMLAGCIACGFTGGGGLDVMRDGENGYVAADGDAEQLVTAVRRALSDPHREGIREAGRDAAGLFTRAAAERTLLECYTGWTPTLPPARPSLWSRLPRPRLLGR